MKTIMWLCDMSGSFMDHMDDYIRQDVMEKLIDFKQEGDVIAMATDGDPDYAFYKARTIAREQTDGQSPFNHLLCPASFSGAEKPERRYWVNLLKAFGDDHVFVLLDDRSDIRRTAAQFDVATVDMSLSRASADIIHDIDDTRKMVLQSLTA